MATSGGIQGMDEVLGRLNRVVDGLSAEQVEKVMVKGAKVVVAAIQKRTGTYFRAAAGPLSDRSLKRIAAAKGTQFRVLSGRLSRSIKAKKHKNRGATFAAAFAAIDRSQIKGAPHAHLLEFGTSKMPAKPFFRPAVAESEGPVLTEIESSLKVLLGDATK